MIRSLLVISLFVSLPLAFPPSARAQTKPGEIKGQDAMGDKGRSFNDGWSQAPVPREESAAKDAPNPGGRSTGENASRPVPPSQTGSTPGQEPQQPLDHRTPSPSGESPSVPKR